MIHQLGCSVTLPVWNGKNGEDASKTRVLRLSFKCEEGLHIRAKHGFCPTGAYIDIRD